MTKILSRPGFRRLLGATLSLLLIAALAPHFQPAYGESGPGTSAAASGAVEDSGPFDGPVDDNGAEGGDDAGSAETPDEGADDGSDGEGSGNAGAGEGSDDASEGDAPSSDDGDGNAVPSGDTAPADEDPATAEDPASADAAVSDEPVADADDGKAEKAEARLGNKTETLESSTAGTYVYSDGGTHTLTINKGVTLTGHIEISNGTTLNLKGNGTINGAGSAGSIITVTGAASTLNLNHDGGNVTIKGGTGTRVNKPGRYENLSAYNHHYVAGGGILVQVDADGNGGAKLDMRGGTVAHNTANAGGGIFIDRTCSFYMNGGAVKNNTAKRYEGGGIFTAGNGDGRGKEHVTIAAGTITGNTSETTFAWGGGGIFVENAGILKLESARITANTAQGLGGGISGCPHAKIGIGDITEGAAIYENTATKERRPSNSVLHKLATTSSVDSGKTIISGDLYAYGDGGTAWASAQFTADKAMDFYCTKVSYVFGYDLGQAGTTAWTGYMAGPSGGKPVTIEKQQMFVANDASLGLTSTNTSIAIENRAVEISGNTSYTHGGGIGCNGQLLIGNLNSVKRYNPFSLSFKKEFKNSAGDPFPLKGGEFTFQLLDGKKVVAEASNAADGTVRFDVTETEKYLTGKDAGDKSTARFTLREVKGGDGDVSYDETEYLVTVELRVLKETVSVPVLSLYYDVHTPDVTSVTIGGTPAEQFSILNTLQLKGSWEPEISKHYYGSAENPAFSFTLAEMESPEGLGDVAGGKLPGSIGGVDLHALKKDEAGKPVLERAATCQGTAAVKFGAIDYTTAGTHWYRIVENGRGDAAPGDPTVYVVAVEVGKARDNRALEVKGTAVYFADSLASDVLTKLEGDEATMSFYNGDETMAAGLFGFAVHAASGEPMERKCLVDPKIYKELEGRTMKPDEFRFQLVWANAAYESLGEVISETGNDQYGMVDFDAANNQAGEGEDPSCLLFTEPGTYYYRVVEDADYVCDPSIQYSSDVITFTVKVEEVDGALKATQMYYGHLVDGENVPYLQQFRDPETGEVPTEVPDHLMLQDTGWHPTMVNQARPMDLAVRKTSEMDRTQGLEGATYGLYMVNDAEQGDVYLASATSDADGWIYYREVNLNAGALYYFKEEAAPAGHTVSEFRSAYFYLERDETAGNGFVMKYADTKGGAQGAQAQETGAAQGTQAETRAAARADAGERDGADDGAGTAPAYGKDGSLLFVYDRDGGVYDEPTLVEVAKLDSRSHEWVEGAKLSIAERDTGKVVAQWTSGQASETLEGVLNVGTVYVLREDEPPADYKVAALVEFVIDQYGSVEILSGGDNGNAELLDSTIKLYDTLLTAENVVTENRENVREVPGPGTTLARTGDALALGAVALVACAALVVLALAIRKRRRS